VTGGQCYHDLHSEDQAQQGREALHENHAVIFWMVIIHSGSRLQANPVHGPVAVGYTDWLGVIGGILP